MNARLKTILLRTGSIGLGTLWVAGCVTDAQLRDFFLTTSTRVFWQTIGSVIQAAIVGAAGGA